METLPYVENARKMVGPLVHMDRHINQSRCERYLLSVGFLCVIPKEVCLLLRTGISKVNAKNTYVPISRYIKVQHHTLWYYPCKESGYQILHIKRVELCVWYKRHSFTTGTRKAKAKSTHVLNSTCITHNTTLRYSPAEESRPIFEASTCPRPHLHTN